MNHICNPPPPILRSVYNLPTSLVMMNQSGCIKKLVLRNCLGLQLCCGLSETLAFEPNSVGEPVFSSPAPLAAGVALVYFAC